MLLRNRILTFAAALIALAFAGCAAKSLEERVRELEREYARDKGPLRPDTIGGHCQIIHELTGGARVEIATTGEGTKTVTMDLSFYYSHNVNFKLSDSRGGTEYTFNRAIQKATLTLTPTMSARGTVTGNLVIASKPEATFSFRSFLPPVDGRAVWIRQAAQSDLTEVFVNVDGYYALLFFEDLK